MDVGKDLYAKYPDVNALADAQTDEIEKIVKPCGLGHSKARDISACMKNLHFFRVFDTVYQAHAVYQADTVGICNNGRFSKYISHNQIRAALREFVESVECDFFFSLALPSLIP